MGQGRFGLKDRELLEIARDLVSELEGQEQKGMHAAAGGVRTPERGALDGASDRPMPLSEALDHDFRKGSYGGGASRTEGRKNVSEASYLHLLRAGNRNLSGRRPVFRGRDGALYYGGRAAHEGGGELGRISGAEYEAKEKNEPEPDFERLSAEGLSEAFRRDARRYDTAFERY